MHKMVQRLTGTPPQCYRGCTRCLRVDLSLRAEGMLPPLWGTCSSRLGATTLAKRSSSAFHVLALQKMPRAHVPTHFGRYCNDVWAVDLDTMTWHNPTCSGRAPGPRYGHSVTVVDYKVYVFGGRGPAGLLHNDLWCLDIESWKWTLMPSTTAPPLARFNHTAAAVGNKIAFFGGWDGTTAFNDLWVYDICEFPPALHTVSTPHPTSPKSQPVGRG